MKKWWIDENGKLKDGWYYIRTWEDMKNEYGLYGEFLSPKNNCFLYTENMENNLPPTRCIFIKNERVEFNGLFYAIKPWMIENPAFKIGEDIEVSDFGCYSLARPIQKEKTQIEITVKINGEECKLSDISEETLLKIRNL